MKLKKIELMPAPVTSDWVAKIHFDDGKTVEINHKDVSPTDSLDIDIIMCKIAILAQTRSK